MGMKASPAPCPLLTQRLCRQSCVQLQDLHIGDVSILAEHASVSLNYDPDEEGLSITEDLSVHFFQHAL